MRMNRFWIFALFLLSLGASPSFGCGDYCDYSIAYDLGGYNFYDFSVDLSVISTYGSSYYSGYDSYSNWGGSCTSLYGCSSCYDIGLLSGYSNSSSYFSFPLDPYLTYPGLNPYTWPSTGTSPISMPYPYQPSIPPIVGFPTYPVTPPTFPITYPTPTYPTYPTNPPSVPYPSPVFPAPSPIPYPSPINNPPTVNLPPVQFPPSLPYGGCDNVIVMCPGGPVTRPGPSNPPTTIPTPPNYQPITSGSNSDPIRYRVPRGVGETHY